MFAFVAKRAVARSAFGVGRSTNPVFLRAHCASAQSCFRTGEGSTVQDPVWRAKQLLLKADAVFFDVDSTVVTTEGIDLLGRSFGVEKEISELTHQAMNGALKFQDAMKQRLELMAEHGLTKERLESVVKMEAKPQLSPGVREVVKRLREQGTDVYLVSGGFRNMIEPVAAELGIPQEQVYANEILFDEEGRYAGFDRTAPTARSGGKPVVLKEIEKAKGYKNMVMCGDGDTDMESRTQGPASVFVGYGGVTERQRVKENADWFIYSFQEILDIMPTAAVGAARAAPRSTSI